jgi:hypothetical protein
MKRKNINIGGLMFIFAAGLFFQACKDEPIGQQPMDSIAPGKVTQITSRGIPGGAVIYYKLPKDEDLLYVKAIYSLQNEVKEAKSSVYKDSIEIAGFGDTQPRQIQLIAVDRSKNESEPESTTVEPLTPPVISIGETLELVPDFGGIRASWENPTRANISVFIMMKDKNDDLVPLETFYSSQVTGSDVARGMDTIPVDVITYVQDRWGNRSASKSYTITPIYETEFNKDNFRRVRLDNDVAEFPGYTVDRIWDKNKNGDPCYSSPAGTGIWPQWLTFDLGVVGKLSRMRIYQRSGGNYAYAFHEGNLREFEIWGCLETPPASGDWSTWTKLADCVSVKPSGLPNGTNTDEDIKVVTNGEDFLIPLDAPVVRYLRILVKRTWADGTNFQTGEIDVFGDDRY